jgi:ABC-2 family transporter
LRSPEAYDRRDAPFRPLLVKELREIISGRALWLAILLMCPLIGFSFFQAVSLYGESSAAGLQSPVLAASLSPLDGVLVPSFGAFYVAVTLLFPFVAIRALSHEKDTGALRLLVQLPYPSASLIAAKFVAVLTALLFAAVPVLTVLAAWALLGGHLDGAETLNLLLGHLLYGALVGAIALLAASLCENAATAAIVALAVTIGSWVLDVAAAGRPGVLAWISRLSLTQVLRSFEQGLFSAGLAASAALVAAGCLALAGIWLPPGVPVRSKVLRSAACVVATALAVGLLAQIKLSVDVTADQRNSFPAADRAQLATLTAPLDITVHLAPEDPRYIDLHRNVLAKLERAMPNVTVRLATARAGAGDESYGEVEYVYATRRDVSRSTSPREILPLLYGLAGVSLPAPAAGGEYPGYPLVANEYNTLPWFFGVLPLLIALAWWWSRRPPSLATSFNQGGQP